MFPRTAFFFRVRRRQAVGTAGCAARRGSAGAIVGERIEGRPGRPGREEAAGRVLKGNGGMFHERVSGIAAGPAPAAARGVSGAGRRPAGGVGGVERGVRGRRAGFVRVRRAESVYYTAPAAVQPPRLTLDNCYYRALSAPFQCGNCTAAKSCHAGPAAASPPITATFRDLATPRNRAGAMPGGGGRRLLRSITVLRNPLRAGADRHLRPRSGRPIRAGRA